MPMGDFYPASLFVSYSHKDDGIVRPLVGLNEDLQRAAWVDYLHTPPGTDWGETHRNAIKKSYRLILLWSKNALESMPVEREWRWALECGTNIVPVLLDNTPLPQELAAIHAVSLREYVSSKKMKLTLARFPPTAWMGLGTVYDSAGVIAGAIVIPLIAVFSCLGVASNSPLWKVAGWIGIPISLVFGLGLIRQIPVEVNRYRLRHRLSRIVVESLKEWGRENRAR
jgi:hypothetical protein